MLTFLTARRLRQRRRRVVVAAAIRVRAGGQIARVVAPATLKAVAGLGFITIGVWTLLAC